MSEYDGRGAESMVRTRVARATSHTIAPGSSGQPCYGLLAAHCITGVCGDLTMSFSVCLVAISLYLLVL